MAAVDLRGERYGQLFPWPGGKRRIAAEVWARLGERPERYEHVNDADGLLVNAWRAVAAAPAAVADRLGPLMHDELTVGAWGRELVARRVEVRALLLSDPRAFDLDLAVAWLQGICLWLGWGWPNGRQQILNRARGILAPARRDQAAGWLDAFAARLAGVQVSCGDWSRVLTPGCLSQPGVTFGIFLDPPYRGTEDAYAEGAADVASAVESWCREHGGDPRLRIVLCGHEGDYDLPGWTEVTWERHRGNGNEAARGDERLWCSPACLTPDRQLSLLGEAS